MRTRRSGGLGSTTVKFAFRLCGRRMLFRTAEPVARAQREDWAFDFDQRDSAPPSLFIRRRRLVSSLAWLILIVRQRGIFLEKSSRRGSESERPTKKMSEVFHSKTTRRINGGDANAAQRWSGVDHGKICVSSLRSAHAFPDRRTSRQSATRGLGLRFRSARFRSTQPFHPKKTACVEPRVAHLDRWAKESGVEGKAAIRRSVSIRSRRIALRKSRSKFKVAAAKKNMPEISKRFSGSLVPSFLFSRARPNPRRLCCAAAATRPLLNEPLLRPGATEGTAGNDGAPSVAESVCRRIRRPDEMIDRSSATMAVVSPLVRAWTRSWNLFARDRGRPDHRLRRDHQSSR